MSRIFERLSLQLAEYRYAMRVVSTRHLPELQEEIDERLRQGLLNEVFFQERLAWFNFKTPESLADAQSLIVVAVPRPQTQAVFAWNGRSKALMLPPTYTGYKETAEKVQALLAEILGREGYRVVGTALPLKLLSVRSGLAEYGRNNICYVVGMGSFLQLVAVYSDMPCEKDQWQEARMMKSCENCQLCRQACPTGAIPSDRFLLRAERCIVYHNERKGDIPFPEWINPSWHNCVVGCLYCQRACPHNKGFLQWTDKKEEFTEKETALLLEGVPRDRLAAETMKKLESLALLDYLDELPRNLSAFFKKCSHQRY
jgi:epoxyqueuosine reductase